MQAQRLFFVRDELLQIFALASKFDAKAPRIRQLLKNSNPRRQQTDKMSYILKREALFIKQLGGDLLQKGQQLFSEQQFF